MRSTHRKIHVLHYRGSDDLTGPFGYGELRLLITSRLGPGSPLFCCDNESIVLCRPECHGLTALESEDSGALNWLENSPSRG